LVVAQRELTVFADEEKYSVETKAVLRRKREGIENRIERRRHRRDEIQHSIMYFENIRDDNDKKVKTTDERKLPDADTGDTSANCSICLEDDYQQKSITTCGHFFCYPCIVKSIRHSPACPTCRKDLTVTDIYRLADENTPAAELADKRPLKDLAALIKRHGTKIGNLIHCLKALPPGEKSIVFSQWDRMLKIVKKSLKLENIDAKFCTGSVYQKRATVREFIDSKNLPVLLLSLEHTASGLNLTCSRNIFLLDSVKGTVQEIKSIESQAIARSLRIGQTSTVRITRFIMRATIEEEIFNATREPTGVIQFPAIENNSAVIELSDDEDGEDGKDDEEEEKKEN
jgi:hypothetical protein